MCPRVPFAVAIALGDPGDGTALAIRAVHGSRFTELTRAALVRANGNASEPVLLHGPDVIIAVPSGEGGVWLLLTNTQNLAPPDDREDARVFDLESFDWM
jgi:hypothetical protein